MERNDAEDADAAFNAAMDEGEWCKLCGSDIPPKDGEGTCWWCDPEADRTKEALALMMWGAGFVLPDIEDTDDAIQ